MAKEKKLSLTLYPRSTLFPSHSPPAHTSPTSCFQALLRLASSCPLAIPWAQVCYHIDNVICAQENSPRAGATPA